ncbi:MAG: enoyl-CoA hydratase/isomerase family protein [Gammaproteobacteria bacterium]|nr:MAG: enoyl-CoA hydratase/isomerase family protein [Gammaproteobacteria bacterium]
MKFEDYQTFKFERDGRILTVTINRPDHMNAVNERMHREMASVFHDVQKDRDSDVVVLTGAGRAFCAGGDTAWFQKMIDDPAEFEVIITEARSIVMGLLELEKPIICRLNGAAAGLGATIALLCDIVIASEKALIGDPHVCMGLVAGDGGCVIWPQLIGFNKAKELLMLGDMLKAAEADKYGLINHLVAHDELDAKTNEIAGRLAGGATKAIRFTKITANVPLRKLAAELMDVSLPYEALTNMTNDHQEAINAFNEKRKAQFTGS